MTVTGVTTVDAAGEGTVQPGPDQADTELAALAVRVHCATPTPAGDRCLNCGWAHPCSTHRWGTALLVTAGWSPDEIAGLDQRSGAWA